MKIEIKKQKRQRRHKMIRAEIKGTAERPRLCVFRSAKHIYAQLINDEKNTTILSVSDFEVKKAAPRQTKGKNGKESKMGNKENKSFEVGKLIAKIAKEAKIGSVVFDRGGFVYHGRIKAVADGAREGGLKF